MTDQLLVGQQSLSIHTIVPPLFGRSRRALSNLPVRRNDFTGPQASRIHWSEKNHIGPTAPVRSNCWTWITRS